MHRYFSIFLLMLVGAFAYTMYLGFSNDGNLAKFFSTNFNFSKSTSTEVVPKQPKSNDKNIEKEPVKENNTGSDRNVTQIKPPAGFTVAQLSPYYNKIIISSVSKDFSKRTINQITIRTNSFLKEKANITGWHIKNNKGVSIYMPKAVSNFNLRGAWFESDLVLAPNNYVYVYNSQSPIGRNFRLNKCTGYLNNYYKFMPNLPNSCPRIDRGEIISFSGKCQNILTSLGSCKEIKNSDWNTLVGDEEANCRAYVSNFNYGGCYSAYYADRDFLSKEWRVWLNTNISFDMAHDRLLLFDNNGLLVNEKIY